MKVVLKDTITEQLLKRIHDARRDGREVEHIILTVPEYDQLVVEGHSRSYLQPAYSLFGPGTAEKVSFKSIDLPVPGLDARYAERRRFAPAYHTFHGYTIYMVPPGWI